ncbi:hypothetical protein BN873_790012 [Candidatus Competibacter denitrificans Run_A_D11]|uniref:Uncharacterized protein n=1 Tax=Candidatus Competibacter denitrificans Run_A_D11 TaxID=1400863 RepID=W6M7T4_9GAMM|nr:hypothetical protein BN873_790012 [Candidatus Competibacter denitrificans Run_A_D11]
MRRLGHPYCRYLCTYQASQRGWWSGRGSNPRPSHCERDALPAELPPHLKVYIEGKYYNLPLSYARPTAENRALNFYHHSHSQ